MLRAAALLYFFSVAGAAHSQIVINEIGIAPTGGNGSQFVELFNRGGCTVDLSCYTLVFSSTSGSGNPTGWTVKIPSGKSIAAGGYFLLGGTAGTAGVSGGTGYPTGGVVNSYAGVADVNIGSTSVTANAVYMKQALAAGNFPNTKGQLSLLDAAGNPVTSVSYNNGNNAASFPLSAYTTCNASGNAQGVNNITDPGASVNNVTGTFTAATNQGIYLSNNGTYLMETSLTPGASNESNGGTQICSGPVLNAVSNAAVCFNTGSQTLTLSYSSANAPIAYTLAWDATAAIYFAAVNNATLGSNIPIAVPANTPPGTYTGYLTLNNACGSSCTKPFSITVNALPPVSAGSYAPVCINSSAFALNGTPVGGTFSGANVTGNIFSPPVLAGNYIINYTYTDAVTGCSNNASATINVSAPASTYTTACTNSTPFIFFGQPFSTTGLHTVVLNNGNGCADTARLYLVVKQTVSVDTSACDSLVYNGRTYYSNTYLAETVGSLVTDCDSVEKNVRLRIRRSTRMDTTICLPPNGSTTLLGQTFAASGHYFLHTINAESCDSAVHLNLTVAATQMQVHTGCDSVRLNGRNFFTSTTFTDTLRSEEGCDSLIRTNNVIVYRTAHTFLNICLAAGQSYNFNGQLLTRSGDYAANLNGFRCDSIVHLHLLIAQQQTIAYQRCNSFTYNGVTYFSSTTLMDTLRSAIGCDSVVRTIQIIIAPVLHTSINACIQEGQSYLFNNQNLTTGGHYTAQLTTQGGCDSIVHLYLTVASTQTQNISGCDSLLWRGRTYYASTRLIDTLRSLLSSCDSLYQITNLTIDHSARQQLSVCLGAGQTYSFNGQVLNGSGQYTAVFVRPGYCDSTVNLKLAIASIEQQTINGCGSVSYNGTTYTSSTVLSDTLQSLEGCDSVYRIVRINVRPTLQTFATACMNEGQSYTFNGQALTATGFYTAIYHTANCDSTVSLYLTVTKMQGQSLQGCDSILFKGKIYYASTVVRDTARSLISGCDSIVTINTLTVHQTKHLFLSVCLQPNQSYNFNGQLLNSTGNYQTTYSTNVCDSVVRLYLVVSTINRQSLSGCDSVVFKGKTYTTSALITDTVKSLVTQCDSIVNVIEITVNKKPVITTSRDTTICRWGTAVLNASSTAAIVNWTGFGNTNSIAVSPQKTTQYFTNAVDLNGCRNTKLVTVSVEDFSVSLRADVNPVLSGKNVSVLSSGNYFYSVAAWQPANLFSNQTGKTQRFAVDTSVNIAVVGQSSLGCKDTARLLLIAIPLDDVYIPSAFTPNGDGRNDEVKVMGTAIQELSFTVFNRWGQVIFHTTDKSKGWDGKFAGMLQPAGTYVYTASVKKSNGQTVEKKGTVTLIR